MERTQATKGLDISIYIYIYSRFPIRALDVHRENKGMTASGGIPAPKRECEFINVCACVHVETGLYLMGQTADVKNTQEFRFEMHSFGRL